VAYLGPPGTFGEEAALRFAPDAEFVARPSHAAVAAAVEAGEADAGVLAIENSINGSVAETLDVLIHEAALPIQAELVLPIVLNLVAAPGIQPGDVQVIYSHPQPLGQSRHFLEASYPDARLEAALSTSDAVVRAMKQPGAAAISNLRAAELYGAGILNEGVQDVANNVTRFVVVGHERPSPTGRDRTSIAFWFADDSQPGSLAGALNEFANRGINLSKLESRPTRQVFGESVFLIDFEGHAEDPDCAAALAEVRRRCTGVTVFGSYPRVAGGR
jgi:prephenate dehydratase